MGYDSPDWTQPATIASGIVQVLGGSQVEGGPGATLADQSWVNLAPTAGREVLSQLIINRGAAALEVAYGAASTIARHTIKPGESIQVPFAGTIRLRSATAAAGAYEWTPFER